MATIALFAALGGGYAVAFKGSGTLQKGGAFGFEPSTEFTKIRKLTGIGRIDARCTETPDTTLEIRLHILSNFRADEGAIFRQDTVGTGTGGDPSQAGSLAPGEDETFQAPSGLDLIRLYVGTNEEEGNVGSSRLKRPQAQIEIATEEPIVPASCGLARVEVLALNTED